MAMIAGGGHPWDPPPLGRVKAGGGLNGHKKGGGACVASGEPTASLSGSGLDPLLSHPACRAAPNAAALRWCWQRATKNLTQRRAGEFWISENVYLGGPPRKRRALSPPLRRHGRAARACAPGRAMAACFAAQGNGSAFRSPVPSGYQTTALARRVCFPAVPFSPVV